MKKLFKPGEKVYFKRTESQFVEAQVEYCLISKDEVKYHLAGWTSDFKQSELKSRLEDLLIPKGDWIFERSSGYAGLRCRKCATWLCEDDILICDCDKN